MTAFSLRGIVFIYKLVLAPDIWPVTSASVNSHKRTGSPDSRRLTSRQFRGINDDSLWVASKSKRYVNLVSTHVAIFKKVVLLFLNRIPVRFVFPTR